MQSDAGLADFITSSRQMSPGALTILVGLSFFRRGYRKLRLCMSQDLLLHMLSQLKDGPDLRS